MIRDVQCIHVSTLSYINITIIIFRLSLQRIGNLKNLHKIYFVFFPGIRIPRDWRIEDSRNENKISFSPSFIICTKTWIQIKVVSSQPLPSAVNLATIHQNAFASTDKRHSGKWQSFFIPPLSYTFLVKSGDRRLNQSK